MTSLSDLRRAAKSLGCDIEVLRRSPKLDVNAYSPPGYRWAGDELHVIVGHQLPGLSDSDVYADMIERMREPIEQCPDDCDCGW